MTGVVIFQREWMVLVRRKVVYVDRFVGLGLGLAGGGGGIGWWEWRGWDRGSMSGVLGLALATFGLMVVIQGGLILVQVVPQVATAIAGERHRASLDAVLTTRLSSAEIVLGVVGVGLARWANGLIAVVPLVIILAGYGGLDPRLLMLAGVGLGSTAFAMAAIAVVVSTHARTSRAALNGAVSLIVCWVVGPALVVLLKPRIWPSGPRWLVSVAIGCLSTSPFGVFMSLVGLIPRGSLDEAVWRMIGGELALGGLLVAWAIGTLRPASRTLADDAVRITGLRMMRAMRRHHRRPPCGDDPVLWNTIHSNRSASRVARVIGGLIGLGWTGALVVVVSWFALPAFRELLDRGYHPEPAAFAMPEGSPLVRMLLARVSGLNLRPWPAAGLARQEFGLALRQFSGLAVTFLTFALMVGVAESVWQEKDRGTWSELIATPLTGWEIVRGKLLGLLVRLRGAIIVLVGLWTLGLVVGSVHPLGYLAALLGLAAICGCFTALGFLLSLTVKDRQVVVSLGTVLPFITALCAFAILIPGGVSLLGALLSSTFLAYSALLSFEDVATLVHSGAMPMFAGPTSYQPGLGTRWVAVAWLLGTAIHAVVGLVAMRTVCRGFDAMVGRPTRSTPMAGVGRLGPAQQTPAISLTCGAPTCDVENCSTSQRADRDGVSEVGVD